MAKQWRVDDSIRSLKTEVAGEGLFTRQNVTARVAITNIHLPLYVVTVLRSNRYPTK